MYPAYSLDSSAERSFYLLPFSFLKYVRTGNTEMPHNQSKPNYIWILFSIRGAINAMGFLMCSLGSLTAFIFAMFVDFRMQAIYALSIPLLFAFVFYFVPETPAYLYSKNKIEVTSLSFIFLFILEMLYKMILLAAGWFIKWILQRSEGCAGIREICGAKEVWWVKEWIEFQWFL